MDDLFMDLASMEQDLLEFLFDNNNPTDYDIHEWADVNGYNPNEVREKIYKLASVLTKFLLGGRANEKNVMEVDVDPDELRLGTEVESEHTSDEATARRIALDHLAELPDYYTRLKKMESEGESEHE